MSDYTESPPANAAADTPYEYRYKKDYISDWDVHRKYVQTFDAYEAMLIGMVYDSVSNSVDGSKITDGYSMTLAKERADRVVAKLPDGQTVSAGKADVGKAAFMDILRQKWIYPNANAQHSYLEKLNMWQLYSSVYGYMPMFYDWNASPSGYLGPDCWLYSPRNLVPQQGKVSIRDMEYVTALAWVGRNKIEDLIEDNDGTPEDPEEGEQKEDEEDNGGWDVEALKMLLEKVDTESRNPDFQQDSQVTRNRTPQSIKKGICLATRYEAGEDGEWCTFAPDHGYIEVRRIKNPHKNGRIPFVIKYSQPLFDSFYGLGDFQRAKPLQFARDGLTNFYFKGIKMNLIPPLVANANGVMKHTLDYREGAVMLETIPNSIRRLETSTAGLATYQAAQDSLTASLLSLYGSQNASISAGAAMNPSQGKTPQAIDLYADKEATRDGSERRHLESAIEELTEGFFSMVVNIGTEDIPIALFADDIEDIVLAGLGDVKDLFKNFKPNENGSAGELKIDPTALKGIEYRFKIDQDSTAKANKQAMLAALQDFLGTVGKLQNIFTEDPTVKIHWDKIMDTYEELSGIPNAKQFMTFDPNAVPPQPQAQAPTPASQSSVAMPTGQVHELADLGKLYLNTTDWYVKNQILVALGFQPAPQDVQASMPDPNAPVPPGPTTTSSGHTFNDPNVAAAAEAIHAIAPTPVTPPAPAAPAPVAPVEPTVASSGHAFKDATIAKAADAIQKIASPPPPKLGPEPKVPESEAGRKLSNK